MNAMHNYSFRNVDPAETPRLSPTPNAAAPAVCTLDESWEIVVKNSPSRLTRYFSDDLCRFLGDAFGIYLRVRRVDCPADALKDAYHKIFLFEAADVPDAPCIGEMKNTYHISVTADTVTVVGRSDRGTAQGAYHMEDEMKLRGEPRLASEHQEHAPLFSPRLTHSGTELDTFPDSFLAACSHAGMDAIMVFTGHVDTMLHGFPDPDPLWPGSGRGYCDFNNLVWRAEGFGLDVYIYSELKCDMHPRDPAAWDYYNASFGEIFRKCPGLKGVIFVGECFEFPSLDPHTCGCRVQIKDPADKRRGPGWYPCFDYPELVTLIRDVIYQHNPEADVVLWSYNWGWAPKEARLDLIRALPKDITLLVTFDMFEKFRDEKGRSYSTDDYSISFTGPSSVYLSEAEEAKRCGIRLYCMANTGGRTWDNGITPYLPTPQQWQRRYEQLRISHGAHGLAGLMENHHYGWLPSFLTLFEKNAFTTNSVSDGDMLRMIALRDFGQAADKALRAWELFSEGIRRVIPAACDQYGPYRSGPTYPLLFTRKTKDLTLPAAPWATHGGFDIWFPEYPMNALANPGFASLRYERVCQVRQLFQEGCTLLREAAADCGAQPGSEQSRQVAVAEFLYCCYVTAAHVMRWTIAKELLFLLAGGGTHENSDAMFACIGLEEKTPAALARLMRGIAEAETANVARALELHHEDSSIGFEATMEYMFDGDHAAWKNSETQLALQQLDAFMSGMKA